MRPRSESNPTSDLPLSWQHRVLERSLGTRHERAADDTARIVDTTLRLLAEVGADFTVQDVTDRANVSRRRFYQHFVSKDDLLLAVCASEANALLHTIGAAVESAPDGTMERLRAALTWDRDGEPASRSARFRGLAACHHRLRETRPGDLDLAMVPAVEYLAELIGACRDEGLVVSGLSDVELGELTFRLFSERLVRRWLSAPADDVPTSADADVAVRFVFDAIFGPSISARH